jgi:acyl dehydratase
MMARAPHVELVEGAALPAREMRRIDRTVLALFAGGSGDHNPLHLDPDFARREGGLDDVIGHGMLTMALIGRYLSDIAPQSSILSLQTRFAAQSRLGDVITCGGKVVSIAPEAGALVAELEVSATRANGEALATGAARVRVDP